MSRTSCSSIPDGPFFAVTLPSLLSHEREHTVSKVRENTPCPSLRKVCSGEPLRLPRERSSPSSTLGAEPGAGVLESPHRVFSLSLSPPAC